ncbi:MAG: glycosyltransferase family 2 protein [Cocleimonas sp.]
MNPTISVIIPLYNVEHYIDKCLQSVRDQTLSNIEIICINDCSPDNSHLIAEKHASVDPRISLINHSENLGVGGARNSAIDIARADFIVFVDSDDYIKEDMLEKLWNASNNGEFDVICCGFIGTDDQGKILAEINYEPREISNIDNSLSIFSVFNPALWNKLWRKDLFTKHDIYFPPNSYFEDMSTQPRLLNKAKNLKVIDDYLYYYNARRIGSITCTYSQKHQDDIFAGFEIILNYLEENDLVSRYGETFNHYIDSGVLNHAKRATQSDMSDEKLAAYLNRLLQLKNNFLQTRDFLESKNADKLEALIQRDSA